MPLYEFRTTTESACTFCADGFERLLRLGEVKPSTCPECAGPVAQVISAPHVQTGHRHRLSESHLEKHGFTQYRKAGGGVYEKTAGKGPDLIADDGK